VSARHQAKRLNRHFDGVRSFETGSAEEAQYPYWCSSFGADPKVRNFTGALSQLRFGPDVFADALVPLPAHKMRGVLISNPRK
jgi:hypothetical protein